MSDRFYIEDDGVCDRNKDGKRLPLWELCVVLNALHYIADKNVDEYEYILKLERENELLRKGVNHMDNVLDYYVQENIRLRKELEVDG